VTNAADMRAWPAGASPRYVAAREELLEAEWDLLDRVRRVAELRRALPPGAATWIGGLVEFRLLGPLEVVDGGQLAPIPSAKHRVLLTCLLVRPGELVTIDELTEAIWGDRPPANPRTTVQTYVSRLRQRLPLEEVLQSRPDGYVLAAARGDIDVGRFEILLEQASQATRAGDRRAEAALLRQALALWRGVPLADVPSEMLQRDVVPQLVEQRLSALQRRIEADLALGRHAEVVAELRALTDRSPLREKYWALLMLALYRCNRQADALQAYQRARRVLVDELGIDPGPELRGLHQAVLTNDPALAVPPAAVAGDGGVRPSQLPLDVAHFVGRADLVEEIKRLLGDDQRVPVVAVSGPPGVGKTALAVHAAHRLAERFPDGRLSVDLQGSTAGLQPLQPMEVLGRFLRALGVAPGAIPSDLAEASAFFRSRVAGRRLLVVLDNAADATQGLPLLPASPGCGVVVTSRRMLTTLEGATHLRLAVLDAGEALALLGRLAGPQRVAAEPQAAAEVARWCGHLPLALRIAGARLAARPAWPVAVLAERLADEQRRLDELELAEVGVRASFAVSFAQLQTGQDPSDRTAATAFELLGVLDGPEVGVPVVARLLELPEEATERVLERLVDAHLLQTPAPGRYRLHDLLRVYARELACQRRGELERAAALTRALGYYTASAWQALAVLSPGDRRLAHADDRWRKGRVEFADATSALAWSEAERPNLLAAIRQAATPGVPGEIATQLAQALFGFFVVRGHQQDWVRANQVALGIARRTGDRSAQAQALNDLGIAYKRYGRYSEALTCHHESLALFGELGDRSGHAYSLINLAIVYHRQGHYEQAVACYQESIEACRALGELRGRATATGDLALVLAHLGRYEEALACQRECQALFGELDDRRGHGFSLNVLGIIYERQGRQEKALAPLREGLAICEALGDRDEQSFSLITMGRAYHRMGQDEQALPLLRESLAVRGELGDPYAQAESLQVLGVALQALGHAQEARAHWERALMIFEQLRTPDADQVRALLADVSTPGAGDRHRA
jgi:DNA-binding SARP family transcriptional activator/DNA polymerase III delta prime subunit